MILYLDDNEWTRIESNTKEYLTGIWGSSEDNIYAVGDNGLILRWNGEDWKAVEG